MLTELTCGNCGAPIPLPGGALAATTCTCAYCGTVFLLSPHTAEPGPEPPGGEGAAGRGEAPEETFSVTSEHGGIRFELTERQLRLPRGRPEGTEIQLTSEPGRRLHVLIPPKSRTREDKNVALVILVFLLLLGGGLLAWGVVAESQWRQIAGGVVLLVFLVFLLAERSLRLSEEIRIEGGRVQQLRRSGGRRQERSLPWSEVKTVAMPVYLELKTGERSLDLAINVTSEERRWIFEELRRFAAGTGTPQAS